MKQLICTFVLAFLSLNVFAIDSYWNVELDEEHSNEKKDFNFCRLTVTSQTMDDEQKATVSIYIITLMNKEYILVFDKDYTEYQLKQKQHPYHICRFDKSWGDKQVNRMEGLNQRIERGPTTGLAELVKFTMNDGEEKDIKIPVYIALPKGDKLLITDMQEIQLHIKVHTKKDTKLPELTKRFDELMEELKSVKFYKCPWEGQKKTKPHNGTVAEQQEVYADKIKFLKAETEQERDSNYTISHPKYAEYTHLVEQLEKIRLDDYIVDCPKNHPIIPRPEPCQYCKAYGNISSVGERMNNLLIKYDNGEKTAKTEAQKLYNAMHSKCTVLKRKWGATDRKKAEEIYNRIKGR